MEILKVRKLNSKTSESEPKGTKREPKGSQKGAKGNPKGAKGTQNRAKMEPKSDQNASKNQASEKVAKMSAKRRPHGMSG